jgi:hypothetical protein
VSGDRMPTRSRAPETLVEFSSSICNHRGDPVRQAKAEEKVVRCARM